METPIIHEEEYRGLKIKIYPDHDAENPRTWTDHFTRMVHTHRRYDLGDECLDADAIKELMADPAVVWLPLYLYDHSGLSMQTRSFRGWQHWEWDSGMVGIIYATRDTLLKEYRAKKLTKGMKERTLALMKAEVQEYDQFLRGDIYGYVVEDEDEEYLDSCWGYYGFEECLREARSVARYHAGLAAKEKALEAMEEFFDNRPEVLETLGRLQAGAV